MTFKEWLLTEADFSGAGEFFYKLSLYPTDAYDGGAAFIDPKDVWALQSRWKIETKDGRKFINLDKDEYIDKKFTTIQSLTMPGNKKWKNSKDNQSDIKVLFYNDMDYLGVKKADSSSPKKLKLNRKTYDLPLDKIFGDQVKALVDISKDFDKPWKKVYENITPYQDVGTTRAQNINMGVRSKWVGPDETGENNDKEKTKIADFGFDKPNPYINRILRRKNDRFKSQNNISDQLDSKSSRFVTSR